MAKVTSQKFMVLQKLLKMKFTPPVTWAKLKNRIGKKKYQTQNLSLSVGIQPLIDTSVG